MVHRVYGSGALGLELRGLGFIGLIGFRVSGIHAGLKVGKASGVEG